MILQVHFRHFELNCLLGNIFQALPFRWNGNSKQFELIHDSKSKMKLKAKYHLHTLFVGIMGAQLLHDWRWIDPSTQLLISFSLFLVLAENLYTGICIRHKRSICQFTNSILKCANPLRKREQRQEFTLLERLNIRFAQYVTVAGISVGVVFAAGFHFRNPCKPSLVGYWLLPQCNSFEHVGSSLIRRLMWFMVVVMNWWFINFSSVSTIFLVSNLQILSNLTLGNLLQGYIVKFLVFFQKLKCPGKMYVPA